MPTKSKVAVIGPGNIGTDLMYKILRSPRLELALLAGIEESEGIRRARDLGVATVVGDLKPLLEDRSIGIVFDATSAKAHVRHAKLLERAGKIAIDLTPAAVGPYVVPCVNLEEVQGATNLNLVTCGGQATVPIVHAIARVAGARYAEMVSAISSKSAGPGTRQNIDEFTRTTARALTMLGGARDGTAFKRWTRAGQVPTQVWYTAYPQASVQNVRKALKLADDVFLPPTDPRAGAWLAELA